MSNLSTFGVVSTRMTKLGRLKILEKNFFWKRLIGRIFGSQTWFRESPPPPVETANWCWSDCWNSACSVPTVIMNNQDLFVVQTFCFSDSQDGRLMGGSVALFCSREAKIKKLFDFLICILNLKGSGQWNWMHRNSISAEPNGLPGMSVTNYIGNDQSAAHCQHLVLKMILWSSQIRRKLPKVKEDFLGKTSNWSS